MIFLGHEACNAIDRKWCLFQFCVTAYSSPYNHVQRVANDLHVACWVEYAPILLHSFVVLAVTHSKYELLHHFLCFRCWTVVGVLYSTILLMCSPFRIHFSQLFTFPYLWWSLLPHLQPIMEAFSTQTLSFTAAALSLTTFAVFAYKLWSCPREVSRAPPIIQRVIPFVGHLLGLLTHGFEYFAHLAFVHPPPS